MRVVSTVLALILTALPAAGDVVRTLDGRTLEGPAHLADGHLHIRSTPPAKLRLDEVLSFQRTTEPPPEADTGPTGVLVEFFRDQQWKERCAVLPANSARVQWSDHGPNAYTPAKFSAEITGFLVAPPHRPLRHQLRRPRRPRRRADRRHPLRQGAGQGLSRDRAGRRAAGAAAGEAAAVSRNRLAGAEMARAGDRDGFDPG